MKIKNINRKSLFIIIALLFGIFVMPYIVIPSLILWWFYKKSKFSKRFKIIATDVFLGLIILLFTMGFISYNNDAEPKLSVTEPQQLTTTVQASQIVIKGTYSPADRTVWINDNEITASNGNFETVYNLNEGENKIEVSAGNIKRARVLLTINRELNIAKKPTNTTAPKETSIFTKNDALKKVQEYKLHKDFPDTGISKGATLLEYYSKRGEIPAVKNEGWFVEETNEKGKYIVSFRFTVEQTSNTPRWEVTIKYIKALNGEAMNYTPELGVQENKIQGSDFEKQVYEYGKSLYDRYEQEAFKLNDANPDESYEIKANRLTQAEERAIKETAEKFGITEKEVIDIVFKL